MFVIILLLIAFNKVQLAVVRSMYFDEDGDLAHEFYVEVHTSRGVVMRREPRERLKPQVSLCCRDHFH